MSVEYAIVVRTLETRIERLSQFETDQVMARTPCHADRAARIRRLDQHVMGACRQRQAEGPSRRAADSDAMTRVVFPRAQEIRPTVIAAGLRGYGEIGRRQERRADGRGKETA